MFSKQYRERYKDALKLQRWPLVDTRKMEKEKKEKGKERDKEKRKRGEEQKRRRGEEKKRMRAEKE